MKAPYQKENTGAGNILMCLLALGLAQCATSNTSVKGVYGPEAASSPVVIEKTGPRPTISFLGPLEPGEFELNYAQELIFARKYKEAEFFIKKSLLKSPGNLRAAKLLPWSYFYQRRFAEAMTAFKNANSLLKQDPEPLIGLGWSYLSLQFFEEALATFENAEIYSENPRQAIKGKGFAHLYLGNDGQAREEFDKIWFPIEATRIMDQWKMWKKNNPDKPLGIVPYETSDPTLFTLPIERPRYESMMFGLSQVAVPFSTDLTPKPVSGKPVDDQPVKEDSKVHLIRHADQLEQAWDYYRKGFYKKALQNFQTLPRPQAVTFDAMNGRAWSHLANGEILQAEDVFNYILRTNPGFFAAIEGLKEVNLAKMAKAATGQFYYDRKKYRIAWNEFNLVRHKFPYWSHVYAMMGLANLRQDFYTSAEAEFTHALRLNPEDKTALEGMKLLDQVHLPIIYEADQELENENYAKASDLYLEYISSLGGAPAMTPARARAQIGLAMSMIGNKQYQSALREFKKIELVEGYEFETSKGLGMAYFNLDNFPLAHEYLKKADTLRPYQSDIQFALDWSRMKSAPPLEAETYFLKKTTASPRRASAYMALGWLYHKNKKPDLGAEYFLKAISLDPEVALTKDFKNLLDHERYGWQVINRLGWAYYHAGLHDKSMKLFGWVLEHQPTSSQAMAGMGYNLYKMGTLEDAESFLRRSLERNPYPVAVGELADPEDSISLYEIETNPRIILARILNTQGKHEEAVQLLKVEQNERPDWPQVHDGLGWSYLQLNRLTEARASFNRSIQLQPANHLSQKGLREVKYRIAENKLRLAPASLPKTEEGAPFPVSNLGVSGE